MMSAHVQSAPAAAGRMLAGGCRAGQRFGDDAFEVVEAAGCYTSHTWAAQQWMSYRALRAEAWLSAALARASAVANINWNC
jgi:hypothetical protein